MKIHLIFSLIGIVFLAGCINTPESPPITGEAIETTSQSSNCTGTFHSIVERIIDGDTLVVKGCSKSIRLSLVNTPETYESGYTEATSFTANLCKVGSEVTVDQDNLQPYDKYGRLVALVYCQGKKLNAELLYNNLAVIDITFCSISEFANEDWAKNYGCGVTQIPENCDSSYPDVCIPSPPPDLDCNAIPYSNFRVLSPDPHRFDGDKDGIGCER